MAPAQTSAFHDDSRMAAPPSGAGQGAPVPPGVQVLFAITAVLITVTLALGSTVCATDASASCPNWPGCYLGRLTPSAHTQPVVEFVHRVISSAVGLFALASVIVGVIFAARDRKLVVLPVVALAGALASGVFGMMTIKWGINSFEAAVDLLAALISMGAMWWAFFVARRPGVAWQWRPVVRLGSAATAMAVVGHFLAVLVAGSGSLTRCMGWALLVRGNGDGPLAAWIAQQAVMVIGELLTIAVVIARLRRRRNGWDLILAGLIVVVLAVGVVIAAAGATDWLGVVHAVGTVLILNLVMTGTIRDAG